MSVRLYIGNVPYRVTAHELAAACAEVVPVQSIYLPIDKETGRPRGFGFVEVADEGEADRLTAQLNGQTLLGRELVVHPARPREMHPPRRQDGHPSHGSAGRSGNHGSNHGSNHGGGFGPGHGSGHGRGGRHSGRP